MQRTWPLPPMRSGFSSRTTDCADHGSPAMTNNMPRPVREAVATTVLLRAFEAGWDDLPPRERSRLYGEWVRDPEIGGVISDYLPPDRVRVWLKDGPMKEYSRARVGLGPFAAFMPQTMQQEDSLIRKVLGNEWIAIEASIQVKPNRVSATNGECEVVLVWGGHKDLKHLVWAWLSLPNSVEGRICVLTTPGQPVTRDKRVEVEGIAAKLGTSIAIVTEGWPQPSGRPS